MSHRMPFGSLSFVSIVLGAGLSLILFLAGCSDLSISTDYDTAADFSGLRTYSWYPEEDSPAPEKSEISPLINARIRAALEAGLEAKGYSQVVNGAPDFLVAYRAAVGRRIETRSTAVPVGYGWGTTVVSGTELYTYDEGTLLVDIVDPKTKMLLWRGTARKAVDGDASAKDRDEIVRNAVEKLLERFPPGGPAG